MDYPNKKDISFIDIYDDEVATYPRAVTYTGTVSTDSQDSKVLIADSDGDGFTTNFVEFGNNVAGFEEIRKGYYLFDGTEIRKVVGVTPSAQAITLDSPFTTSYEGLPLKVIKPILLPRVTFQNTGAVDGSIYTKTSPTDQTQYGSITLKAGDGYTFDSSTLSAFVIDSKNTTVKLSNAFFFEVGASGGGGGSPAGSDNQIQINQSGSFFADSTFQKSDTGFNVGLNHTTQSAVSFTGSGLDDLTLSGTFAGTYPTTYTVTVSSAGTPDTFDWTDGTNSGTGVSMSTSPTLLSNGISITFGADTGHTLTDSWTWTYTSANQNVLDFSNTTFDIQSSLSSGQYGISQSAGVVTLGSLSGGNNTKIQVRDNDQLVNVFSQNVNLGNSGNTNISVSGGSNEVSVSAVGGTFTAGDVGGGGNGTKSVVNDINKIITSQSDGSFIFQNPATTTFLNIDTINSTAQFGGQSWAAGFYADVSGNPISEMGDWNDNGNGTKVRSDDTLMATSIFRAFATPTMYFENSGGDTEIQDGYAGMYYDPASLVAAATITLPANPVDGQEVELIFGGSITSGPVVTALSVSPNFAQSLIGTVPATASVDTPLRFKWRNGLSTWHVIN